MISGPVCGRLDFGLRMNRRRTLLGLLALPFSAITSAFAGTPLEAVLRKGAYECHSNAVLSGAPLTVAVKRVADVADVQVSRRDKGVVIVDFYASDADKKQRQQKSAGHQTYVISSVTTEDIISSEHLNCTGSIFVGRGEGGRQRAFLTHQDPTEVLYENRARFMEDFANSLDEFLSGIERDTVAYGFFGGNYFHEMTGGKGSKSSQATLYSEHYVSSIILLAGVAHEHIPWLEPVVIVGPNLRPSPVHFRFHTQMRMLEVVTEEDLPTGFTVCRLAEYLRKLEKRVL